MLVRDGGMQRRRRAAEGRNRGGKQTAATELGHQLDYGTPKPKMSSD